MKVLIFIILISSSWAAIGQQDTSSHKKIKILPVPAFGYSPETKTYIGAVALFTLDLFNDSLTRTSNAKIEFNYTWRKQIISEIQWNYFTKHEKWFTQGLLHYSKYPDYYYGIGENTADTAEILYQSDRLKIDLNLLRSIKRNVFIGLGIRHFQYAAIQSDSSLLSFPELSSQKNYGLSTIFLNDHRNNILTPVHGHYLKIQFEFNLSSSNYSRTTLDLRKYFSWGTKLPQVLSARLYSSHVSPGAPFYDIALLGGDAFVRGYFYGRFRTKNLTTLQSELRTDLFWRIGLSVFGGYSMIYRNLDNLTSTNFKPNAGIGLRFLVDKNERTNLRFDFAIGQDGQNGFYISFGESF